MKDITELQRRMAAALDRIGAALEALPAARPPAAIAVTADPSAEIARLTEALDAERAANAQLTERVRAIRDKQDTTVAQLDRKLEKQTALLDMQGLELQRMRKTNQQLVDALRAAEEALAAGVVDAHLVNRTMQAELESLRAVRLADLNEIDDVMEALAPLVAQLEAAGAMNGGAGDA